MNDGVAVELLPCPHCGNPPRITNGNLLECPTCEYPFIGKPGAPLAAMILKWNQRVASSVVAGVREHATGVSCSNPICINTVEIEGLCEECRKIVGSGVSSDEEIAREATGKQIRNLEHWLDKKFPYPLRTEIEVILKDSILTAIRKSRALPEPKESEEEKHL